MDEANVIRNKDVENALESVPHSVGVKGKCEQAKTVLEALKTKFSTVKWKEDAAMIRMLQHALEKMKKHKHNKDLYALQMWQNDTFVGCDEAPPSSRPDDAGVPDFDDAPQVVPEPVVLKATVGRPRGSCKRLSDGACKKTEDKIIDEIVSILSRNAEEQNIDRFELLKMVNERCKLKWKVAMSDNNTHVPVSDACAMMYNINLSAHQYQEL